MNYRFLLPLICLSFIACGQEVVPAPKIQNDTLPLASRSSIDYRGFAQLTGELAAYRAERLVEISTFASMLQEENVLLLDTRSARAFQNIHIKGAVHLNFSDFTEEKLAEIIPNKDTKILIYCNNNFIRGGAYLASKLPPLALNIPTFINLYGYGYENIYELDGSYTIEQVEAFLELETKQLSVLPVIPAKKDE